MKIKLIIPVIVALICVLPAPVIKAGEPEKAPDARVLEKAREVWKNGKADEAVALLRKLVTDRPLFREARLALVDMLAGYADRTQEEAVLPAQENRAADVLALTVKARSLRLEALAHVEVLEADKPGYPAVKRMFAELQLSLGRLEKAGEGYENLLLNNTLSQEETKEIKQIITSIEKTIKEKKNAQAGEKNIPEQARDLVAEGRKLFGQKHYSKAASRFEAAVLLSANYTEARLLNAYAMYTEGVLLFKEWEKERGVAEDMPKDSLEKKLTLRRARSARNRAQGKIKRAVDVLDPLVKKGEHAEALILAAKCHLYLNHTADAKKNLEKALEISALSDETAKEIKKLLRAIRIYNIEKPKPGVRGPALEKDKSQD